MSDTQRALYIKCCPLKSCLSLQLYELFLGNRHRPAATKWRSYFLYHYWPIQRTYLLPPQAHIEHIGMKGEWQQKTNTAWTRFIYPSRRVHSYCTKGPKQWLAVSSGWIPLPKYPDNMYPCDSWKKTKQWSNLCLQSGQRHSVWNLRKQTVLFFLAINLAWFLRGHYKLSIYGPMEEMYGKTSWYKYPADISNCLLFKHPSQYLLQV